LKIYALHFVKLGIDVYGAIKVEQRDAERLFTKRAFVGDAVVTF